MSEDIHIRWGWLKFMYIYTIVGAGGIGLGILVVPEFVKALLNWPVNEPVVFGIAGSVWLGFGVLSIFGLRAPLKFAPVLVLQLCYKSIWFIGNVLPLLITGRFPSYGITTAIIFASYIVGDVIAIPFSYLIARQPAQQVQLSH